MKKQEIIVYSQTGCGKCDMLTSILNSKGIEFTLEKDNEKVILKAKELGITMLPILEVKGGDLERDGSNEYLNGVFYGNDAVIYGRGM